MHIAEECGIYTPGEGVAMEASVFRSLPHNELLNVLSNLQVLARSTPQDKVYFLTHTIWVFHSF
jgi:magnesium-transporting ATPase (P-type)